MADGAVEVTKTRIDWRAKLEAIGPRLEAEGRACDADNRFAAENLGRLEEIGLFELGVPQDLGGYGANAMELGAMLRTVGRWDGATALALSMHTHQVAVAAWRRTHQGAPTESLLKAVAQGKRVLSSGGSDWLPGSGKAEKVEGGWKITARKVFSSGAPEGDILMTCAVAGDEVLHFAVPMDSPQVKVVETWDTLGMRGTASHDIVIDGLIIPDDKIAGRRPAGKWHMLFHIISMVAFPLIYSAYAGVADGMRQTVLAGPRERLDPHLVGEMETAWRAVDLLNRRMLKIASCGQPGPETTNEVMALRTLIGRACLEVADKAMECAGGAGFFRKTGLEQRFRDIQAARYHPLQSRAQALYAGRMALGLDIDG